jgi:hypothetical protein
MNCCHKCFCDKVLISYIRTYGTRGACDFCKTRSTTTLQASRLSELFKPLLDLLEPLGRNVPIPGKPLYKALDATREWHIFSKRLTPAMNLRLLKAILTPHGTDVRGSWIPRLDSPIFEEPKKYLHFFSEHIKWERRFLIGKNFTYDPKNWLPQCLPEIEVSVPKGKRFYRARRGCGKSDPNLGFQPIARNELGAPPKEKTTKGGRANPPGISYLYVAEEMDTCIAEVRPPIGDFVSAIALSPKTNLKMADLLKAKPLESPFGHKDLARKMRSLDLLRCLDIDLAEPVNPDNDAIDYVPLQYLVEVIRDAGFDGVRYRSAMRKGGHNVVFFEPQKFEPVGEPRLFRVTGQKIFYKEWQSSDDCPF